MQTEASTKPMKQIDMTCGPIMKKVLLFAIPICAGNLLQQLYNTVDTLVIGNFCGSSSLAAVGTSAQPVEILLCIFLGLGTGVSILASQYVYSFPLRITVFLRMVPAPCAALFAMIYSFRLTPRPLYAIIKGQSGACGW